MFNFQTIKSMYDNLKQQKYEKVNVCCNSLRDGPFAVEKDISGEARFGQFPTGGNLYDQSLIRKRVTTGSLHSPPALRLPDYGCNRSPSTSHGISDRAAWVSGKARMC